VVSRVLAGTVSPEWKIRTSHPDETPVAGRRWTDTDDRTLVAACLAGQRGAFDVIVVRHRRQVY
jgi:hypothetical protein